MKFRRGRKRQFRKKRKAFRKRRAQKSTKTDVFHTKVYADLDMVADILTDQSTAVINWFGSTLPGGTAGLTVGNSAEHVRLVNLFRYWKINRVSMQFRPNNNWDANPVGVGATQCGTKPTLTGSDKTAVSTATISQQFRAFPDFKEFDGRRHIKMSKNVQKYLKRNAPGLTGYRDAPTVYTTDMFTVFRAQTYNIGTGGSLGTLSATWYCSYKSAPLI